jgi:hypothetical protein
VQQRRLGDLARGLAEVAVEAGVDRPAPGEVGDHPHPEHDEPHRAERRGAQAQLRPPPQHEHQPEHGHEEGHVLLPHDGEEEAGGVAPVVAALGAPVRPDEERDGDDLGVERLPREPLQRRLQQPRDAEGGGQPRAPEAVAGQEVEREGGRGEGDDLEDVPQVRAAVEPGEGDEQQVAEGGVVAEHRQAPHRAEVPEVGQQPDGLVVDAEVEVDGAEPVLAQHHEEPEHEAPHRDGAEDDAEGRLVGDGVGQAVVGPPGVPARPERPPRPAVDLVGGVEVVERPGRRPVAVVVGLSVVEDVRLVEVGIVQHPAAVARRRLGPRPHGA